MKNYHGENISVVWWLSKSILQGVLAPTSIVVLALLDINYSLSENIGDGYVRAVAVLFIKLPIFVIIHIFFFVVANYFVNLPIKIIELKRLLKILGILFICSVHDKFHRTLILSGFCFLKIAKISLNSSFFPKPIKC